ncbi:hypothetical protein G6F15_011702 [Rhizopus arrhizus]|nr:hypothetical protein G6F15_011702 [Rhizopus arrhizus]
MGNYTGDTLTNAFGRRVSNWMTANNLILWNERLAYGQPTSYTFQGTSIIDFFFSTTELEMPTLRIRDDLSLNSNHKFMTMTFYLPSHLQGPTDLPRPQRIIWNIGKLKHLKSRDTYRDTFIKKLSLILPPHSSLSFRDRSEACQYIDSVHDQLCDTIVASLDSVCGRRPPQADEYLKDFWTDEMTAAFNRKEYYYKKWRKARGLNCFRYWLQHQEAQAALRRLVTRRRKETWRHFCDQMSRGDYIKAITKFSRIRKNRTVKPTFSTTEGPQHAADTMAHHLEKIFAGELLPNRPDPHTSTLSRSPPDDTTTPPFDVNTCPIDLDSINEAIKQLPRRKAPGVDHFTIEMLSPLTDILTSTFRKILEKCIASDLELESPPLDIAQGGFRRSRSTLDQALCLVETCSILRQHHRITPTLAFLDIKSAYDTVDRDHIWQTPQPSVSPPLLALLRNLFDEVKIEVLLSNATSYRFSPATGVLQGSILSPFLYSSYINQLPALLRTQPIEDVPSTDTRRFAQHINCLLYADDVVLIAAPQDIAILLQQCEDHSHRLGYRWNLLKCAILAPSSDTQAYSLYCTTIPRQGIFSYLGILINPGGYLNTAQLIQGNVNKALQTMNQMTTIGVNNKGFDRLLSVRFYTQIVRSQLEYGLAISSVPAHQLQKLDAYQTQCIRRIFG